MAQKRRRQRHARPGVPQPEQPVSHNPRLTEAILEIVDTQLRDGTPPETMQTLDRLVMAGYTPEGARQLIANVVVAEIFEVMARGEPYKQERFIAALHRLPILPWE
ncbi:MAG: hypothetical protein SH847_03875 [Roseiflexaceae bacterium]|nr:hypothetical protein [Roseiflexaceae bacterium]